MRKINGELPPATTVARSITSFRHLFVDLVLDATLIIKRSINRCLGGLAHLVAHRRIILCGVAVGFVAEDKCFRTLYLLQPRPSPLPNPRGGAFFTLAVLRLMTNSNFVG